MFFFFSVPRELDILIKEHFNRWYSLKAYYLGMTIIDLPVTILGCLFFTVIVYFMSGQPSETDRFFMFFVISILVVLTAQGFGLMVGAVFNVVVSFTEIQTFRKILWFGLEWNLLGPCALCSAYDVLGLWSNYSRPARIHAVGYVCQLFTVRPRGVYWCYLWYGSTEPVVSE